MHTIHVNVSFSLTLILMWCSFCVQWFEGRGSGSLCGYWWNCWQSLFKSDVS